MNRAVKKETICKHFIIYAFNIRTAGYIERGKHHGKVWIFVAACIDFSHIMNSLHKTTDVIFSNNPNALKKSPTRFYIISCQTLLHQQYFENNSVKCEPKPISLLFR